jgi:hypothetical protein
MHYRTDAAEEFSDESCELLAGLSKLLLINRLTLTVPWLIVLPVKGTHRIPA